MVKNQSQYSLVHWLPSSSLVSHKFETVVGNIRFGRNGEWKRSRVLMVQFQGIADNRLEIFEQAGTRVVLHPPEWRSGEPIAPFAAAR